MRCYIEITLIPNADIDRHFLWSKLYQQIHLGLVAMKDGQGLVPIGVSFPEYVEGGHSRLTASRDTRASVCVEKYSVLGGKLRLFAQDETTLAQFNASKWLERLNDYVHCTRIRPVPDKVKGYATYQRVQPKTNPERLARRYLRRWDKHHPGEAVPDLATFLGQELLLSVKGEAGAVAKQALRYCDMPTPAVRVPFIRLQSLSGGHCFCLWVKKSVVPGPAGAAFSTYGLSATATVPEF